MRLSTVVLIVPLALLASPLAAEAQQPAKVFRIGYLGDTPPTDPLSSRLRDEFRREARNLGYVEGQNVVIERRYSEGRYERLPALAADLVRLKVDVIVTYGTAPTLAAKNATTTIPIVMLGVGDPVAAGLIASLARPGGNITGLSLLNPALGAKRLELLKEVVPRATRVGILGNPANPWTMLMVGEIEVAARTLGIELQRLEVQRPTDFEAAFEAARRESAAALIVLEDPSFAEEDRRTIIRLAAKSRLPAAYGWRGYVDAGGLISYGASLPELFRRAAQYVDKILKGAKPADLPVEQPTKFELVINLKTAKTLGLTIPQSVLIRANELIQ